MSLYILGGVTGGLGKELLGLVPNAIPVGRQDCDVQKEKSVQNWTDSINQRASVWVAPFHVINLTGVSHSAMIHKGEVIDWCSMLSVNVIGNALLLKYLRPLFKGRPGSTFTMVGSVTTKLGPAGTGVYTASKAALEGLCKVAAKEFATWGRVNLLELGYCEAGMIKQIPNSSVDAMETMIPLERLGNAKDLATAWEFVRNCSYLTGSTIAINGGIV